MGREKRPRPADRAGPGVTAKERHKKTVRHENNNDWAAPLPQGLVAVPEKQLPKSKHQSYFEIVENRDKKKKLEFQVTNDKAPPPGFEFVPIGNPELTTACKELSREQDAMIFIVSSAKDTDDKKLSIHLHRIGHHIRQTIVEQARATLGQEEFSSNTSNSGEPEPIPETQEEINAQADAALKDLFPRIPNFDRQMIIEHAFKKGGKFGGEPVVGMAADIPLSRRVQLAVLAHIRHNHTRYDKLLKETSYVNARKTVEALCLDILVKWRGDEETGRDQLDEILREVVVISDDSDDSDDDDTESSDDDSVQEILPSNANYSGMSNAVPRPSLPRQQRRQKPGNTVGTSKRKTAPGIQAITKENMGSAKNRAAAKKSQRGFKRYQAEAQREAHYQAAWEQAVNRNRHVQAPDAPQHTSVQLSKPASQGPHPAPAIERVASQRDVQDDLIGRGHPPSNRLHSHVDASQSLEPFYVERNPSGAHHLRATPPMPYTAVPAFSHFREASGPARYRPVSGPPSVPHSRQSQVPAPTRRDPNELKDFLVRSIEPVSPSSAPMPPQFIRPMPYREHVPLEQVSSETHVQNARNRSPVEDNSRYGEAFQQRRFINDHSAPVRVLSPYKVESSVSRSGHHRDTGSFPSAQPQESIRIYRVREPVGSRERPLPPDHAVRVHRGSPRPRLAATEPGGNMMIPSQSRYRELSPHRIIEIRRPVEDLSRPHETRRVVSLESGDSRYGDVVNSRYSSQRNGYIQHPDDRPITTPVEYRSMESLSDPHPPPSTRPGDVQPAPFPVYREVEQRRDYHVGGPRQFQMASEPYANQEFRPEGFAPSSRAYDNSNMRVYQPSHLDAHDPRPAQTQYPLQHPPTKPREGVIFLG